MADRKVLPALVFLGAAVVASVAHPQIREPEWWHVSASMGPGARTASYIDVTSERVAGENHKRAWVTDVRSNNANPPGADRIRLTLAEYDCSEERARALQITVYRGDGALEYSGASGDASGDSTWFYVTPGSVGAAELRFVCSTPEQRAALGVPIGNHLTPRQHAVLYVFQTDAR